MARSADGNARTNALSSTFARSTPPAVQRAAHAPTSLKALSRLEERSAAIKERAFAHYKKFEDRWVAKEAIRIWQRHLAQPGLYPAPKSVDRTVAPEGLSKMASRNVLTRTHQRLARINSIKTRMGNAIVRNLAPPSLKQGFNQAAQAERPTQKQTMKR